MKLISTESKYSKVYASFAGIISFVLILGELLLIPRFHNRSAVSAGPGRKSSSVCGAGDPPRPPLRKWCLCTLRTQAFLVASRSSLYVIITSNSGS